MPQLNSREAHVPCFYKDGVTVENNYGDDDEVRCTMRSFVVSQLVFVSVLFGHLNSFAITKMSSLRNVSSPYENVHK